IEQPEHITTQWFKDEGDAIILLGEIFDHNDPLQGLGGSAYLQQIHGLKTGTPPNCDLDDEANLTLGLRALIHGGVIKSAHDCSEGGLAVALAESCISQHVARETPRLIGANVDLAALFQAADEKAASTNGSPATAPRLDALLFGETQGRVVVSVAPLDAVKVIERAKLLGLTGVRLGTVGGDSLAINSSAGQFAWPITELYDLWWNSIARAMGTVAQASSPAS